MKKTIYKRLLLVRILLSAILIPQQISAQSAKEWLNENKKLVIGIASSAALCGVGYWFLYRKIHKTGTPRQTEKKLKVSVDHAYSKGSKYTHGFVSDTTSASDCSFFGLIDGKGNTHVLEHLTDDKQGIHRKFFSQKVSPTQEKLESFIQTQDTRFIGYSRVGATALLCILHKNQATFANLGDCHGFLIRNKQIIKKTKAHTLDDKEEAARIRAAGGLIRDNKLFGDSAPTTEISRGFGFYAHKDTTSQSPGTLKNYTAMLVSNRPDVIDLGPLHSGDTIILAAGTLFKKPEITKVMDQIDKACTAQQLLDKLGSKTSELSPCQTAIIIRFT